MPFLSAPHYAVLRLGTGEERRVFPLVRGYDAVPRPALASWRGGIAIGIGVEPCYLDVKKRILNPSRTSPEGSTVEAVLVVAACVPVLYLEVLLEAILEGACVRCACHAYSIVASFGPQDPYSLGKGNG